MAGELSEKRGDSLKAVEYYAKGNNFARAVQLAREVRPNLLTSYHTQLNDKLNYAMASRLVQAK